jgi:parvulin-like peptidyl-prolyl isomerase
MKGDTSSFKSYVSIYSETPYKRDTISIVRLPETVKTLLSNAKVGDVVGPVQTFSGFVVYKLVDKVASKNTMVRASHILVKSTGDDKADYKKAMDIYNELMKGANFENEAKLKSDDGSKNNGGDLGWFGKGQMVKPFEEACYNGQVGVIQKPIKTQFGYHIIKVTGKSNTDYVVEQIVNRIQISATTADKIYQDAQDYSYIAKKDGFESEAKLMKYNVAETPGFTKDAVAIPGLGSNAALVKWSFEESTGSISDVFKVPAGYIVSMISDETKAGVKKFDDVKLQVKNIVTRNKKLAKAMSLVADIRSKVGDNGDVSTVAKTVWASAKVDTTSEFTLSGNIPKLGREFAFADYAYKGDLNKWSQPVKGRLGAYLIKVTYRTQFNNSTYGFQKAELKKQLLNSKKSRYFMQWVQDLKKESDIVDNRYLFYRY